MLKSLNRLHFMTRLMSVQSRWCEKFFSTKAALEASMRLKMFNHFLLRRGFFAANLASSISMNIFLVNVCIMPSFDDLEAKFALEFIKTADFMRFSVFFERIIIISEFHVALAASEILRWKVSKNVW